MSWAMLFKMRLFPVMILASFMVGPTVQLTCDPLTQYENGGECCLLCGPGTSMAQSGSCRKPQCEECKENEYQEGYTMEGKCKRQPYCDPHKNFEVLVDQDKTKERTCVCKPGFHCSDHVCLSCVPHTPCGPGREVQAEGSPTSDTVCQRCPQGSFSDITSFNSKCVKWTECASGYHIDKNGTEVSDIVCEKTPRTHTYVWIVLFLLLLLLLVAPALFYLYRRHVQIKRKLYFNEDEEACRTTNMNTTLLETNETKDQMSQEEASSQEPVENSDEDNQGPGNYTDNGNYVVQERGKSEIISRQESQTCTFTDSITPSVN